MAGSLQNTRPDLAAGTSLLMRGSPEVTHLREMYRLIEYAHETAEAGYVFSPIDLTKCIFVGYGDSSWANADGFKSQLGSLVVLTEESAFRTPTAGSIPDHRSSRSRHVVRSTLAAEACACDAVIDRTTYVIFFLAEILTGVPAKQNAPSFMMYAATDCKSMMPCARRRRPWRRSGASSTRSQSATPWPRATCDGYRPVRSSPTGSRSSTAR